MGRVSLPLIVIVAGLGGIFGVGMLIGWAAEKSATELLGQVCYKQLELLQTFESQLQDAWREIQKLKEANDA